MASEKVCLVILLDMVCTLVLLCLLSTYRGVENRNPGNVGSDEVVISIQCAWDLVLRLGRELHQTLNRLNIVLALVNSQVDPILVLTDRCAFPTGDRKNPLPFFSLHGVLKGALRACLLNPLGNLWEGLVGKLVDNISLEIAVSPAVLPISFIPGSTTRDEGCALQSYTSSVENRFLIVLPSTPRREATRTRAKAERILLVSGWASILLKLA